MEKGPKQTFKGQQIQGKMLRITTRMETEAKNIVSCHLTPARTAMIK